MIAWTQRIIAIALINFCQHAMGATSVFNVNEDLDLQRKIPALGKALRQTRTTPLDLNEHPQLRELASQLTQLVGSQIQEKDKLKEIYVVLEDDIRMNGGLLNLGGDRALLMVSLGAVQFVPNVDELGAITAHELQHGASEVRKYAEKLSESGQGVLAALVLRADENQADMGAMVGRMEQAGLNPHAVTSFIARMRRTYGSGSGLTHTDSSSREDSAGTARAMQIRLGFASDTQYRLDESTRHSGWLKPIQEALFQSSFLRDRQKRLNEAKMNRARPEIDQYITMILRDVEPKYPSRWRDQLGYRPYQAFYEEDSEIFARIWGDFLTTPDLMQERARWKWVMERQLHEQIDTRIPTALVAKTKGQLELLLALYKTNVGPLQESTLLPFALRLKISNLQKKMHNSRGNALLKSEKKVEELEAKYSAARSFCLFDATEVERLQFDRKVDRILAENTGEDLDIETIYRIREEFLSQEQERLERMETHALQLNRDLVVGPEVRPSEILQSNGEKRALHKKAFPGISGAALYLDRFTEMIEKGLETPRGKYDHSIVDMLTREWNTHPNSWRDFLDLAASDTSFDERAWLSRFLTLLETKLHDPFDAVEVGNLCSAIVNSASASDRPVRREVALKHLDSLGAMAVEKSAVAVESLSASKVGDLLESLNQILKSRSRTTKVSALEQLIENSAKRLVELSSSSSQKPLSRAKARALVWLKLPALVKGRKNANVLRESVVAALKADAELWSNADRRRFGNLHRKLKLNFNELVEFFSGDPEGSLTPESVAVLKGVWPLIDSKRRPEISQEAAMKIEQARFEYVKRRHPQEFAVAFLAATSMGERADFPEDEFKKMVERKLETFVGSRSQPREFFELAKDAKSLGTFLGGLPQSYFEDVLRETIDRRLTHSGIDVEKARELAANYVKGLTDSSGPRLGSSYVWDQFHLKTLKRLIPKAGERWSDNCVRQVLSIVLDILRTGLPHLELDHLFDQIWKQTESRPWLREPLKDEKIVERLFLTENRYRLVRWQLDEEFQLPDRVRAISERRERVAGLKEFRPVIKKLSQKIRRQIPKRSALRNRIVSALERELVTSDTETKYLDRIALDQTNFQSSPDIAYSDLVHQVGQVVESVGDRWKLVEYFIGAIDEAPKIELKWGRFSEKLRSSTLAFPMHSILSWAKGGFQEMPTAVRSYALQGLFGTDTESVLEDPGTFDQVIDRILGEHAGSEIPRTFLVAYLKALPATERKFVIGYILGSFSEGNGKGASLKTILEAMGPMGIYAGQFLRTSSALPVELRAQLDDFFNQALRVARAELIEKIERGFGKKVVNIVSIEEEVGSGKINVAAKVRLRSERWPGRIETVVVRALKDRVDIQSKHEFEALDLALRSIQEDKTASKEVHRMARVAHLSISHAYENIGPGGKELNHTIERDAIQGDARKAYTSDHWDGVRVEVIKVNEEIQGWIDPKLQESMSVLEYVDHTPLWEIPKSEQPFWARKIVDAERKALLKHGLFDPDPHPGNWLIDLKNWRLVRIDVGQFRSLDKQQHEALKSVFELLMTPEPGKARIDDLIEKFDTLFEINVKPAGLDLEVRAILARTDFPGHLDPEGRIDFIQEELMRVYSQRGTDFFISPAAPFRDAINSLNRIAMYGREYTGSGYVRRSLFFGLPMAAKARIGLDTAKSALGNLCQDLFGSLYPEVRR